MRKRKDTQIVKSRSDIDFGSKSKEFALHDLMQTADASGSLK